MKRGSTFIRLDPAVRTLVVTLAKQETRTIANMIEVLLGEALRARALEAVATLEVGEGPCVP